MTDDLDWHIENYQAMAEVRNSRVFNVIAYNDQKRCQQERIAGIELRKANVLADALAQYIENSSVDEPTAGMRLDLHLAQTMLDAIDAQRAS